MLVDHARHVAGWGLAVALLLVVAGCSDGDGDEIIVDEVEWTTAELDFGVEGLLVWGSSLVGTAEQTFFAPVDLLGETGDGCVAGSGVGRSGEVVQSRDGLTWEALASQPLWYEGPVTVEELGRRMRTEESPMGDIFQVALLVHKEQLFAVSVAAITSGVMVEVWDESRETWELVPGTKGVEHSGVWAAAGPAGLVVLAGSSEGEPLLWTLSGNEMTRAEDSVLDELPFADAYVLDLLDLWASTDGFLAQSGLRGGDMVLWRSDDGLAWNQVADAPTSELNELAAHAGVVIGATGSDELWRSDDDGRTWGLDTSFPNEAVVGIAAGTQGWALSTYLPGPESWSPPPALHISADGRRWQPILEIPPEDADWVTGLVVTDDGFVVVTSYSLGGSGGFDCPDVELESYRAHLADISD